LPRLRIAQVAPPIEAVPPPGYGGIERVVDTLTEALVARGHEVTLFASGDSTSRATHLVPTLPRALRSAGDHVPPWPFLVTAMLEVVRRAPAFDVVHAHLEWAGLLLGRLLPVPMVSTMHGRLDQPWADAAFQDPPPGLVAISYAQAATRPELAWAGVVHNGLRFPAPSRRRARGDDLCFVGRITPEKGVVEAIEIARLSGRRLRIAAKIGWTPAERAYETAVFRPAMRRADVEFLGELSGPDRDRLFAESHATLMPGDWPEPFGLVAIESLACGTPVLARPVGALPEIVRDGVDGFLRSDVAGMAAAVDAVGPLDRTAIRRSVRARFSVDRMVDSYEAIYATQIGPARSRRQRSSSTRTGSEKPNSAPPPGRGRAQMRPPIASTRARHAKRPIPAPAD
jgi:glycosyltransferase involved in cell wall biosynthesis